MTSIVTVRVGQVPTASAVQQVTVTAVTAATAVVSSDSSVDSISPASDEDERSLPLSWILFIVAMVFFSILGTYQLMVYCRARRRRLPTYSEQRLDRPESQYFSVQKPARAHTNRENVNRY